MNPNLKHNRDHAIVIGGSMAGLLATRVAAEHYRQVTLVERDVFPHVPVQLEMEKAFPH